MFLTRVRNARNIFSRIPWRKETTDYAAMEEFPPTTSYDYEPTIDFDAVRARGQVFPIYCVFTHFAEFCPFASPTNLHRT